MLSLVFALWSAPVVSPFIAPALASDGPYAVSWSCGAARWVGEPEVRDNVFSGTMTSDCVVKDAEKNGLASLDEYALHEEATSTRVHAGPIEETYRSLPSVRYDVSNVSKDDSGNTITIRSDDHVATDRRTKLVYSSVSTQITASGGDGKSLKKLDTGYDVIPTSVAHQFKITLPIYTEIKKPSLVPVEAFKKKAMEIVEDQYITRRDKLVPDLARNL